MLRLIALAAAVALLSSAVPAYLMRHGDIAAQGPRIAPAAASQGLDKTGSGQGAESPRYAGRQVQLASGPGGSFITEFRLNGRRMAAVVDTGASAVAINETIARQIGIPVAPEDFRYAVQTANGSTHAAAAVIGEVEIGRIRVEDVQAIVLPDEALPTALIGMTFLGRLSRFSAEGDRLTLVQ
jgi:aspartyl protease family protein